MSKLLYLILVLIIGCFPSCKDNYIQVKGYVIKTDWEIAIRGYRKIRVFYDYYYNDSVYSSSALIGKNDLFFAEGDSLLIKIKEGNNRNPEILKRFYRRPTKKIVARSTFLKKNITSNDSAYTQMEIVIIRKDTTSSTYGLSYYLVDTKPLFKGAILPDMNDSLIHIYVKKMCALDLQEYKKGTSASITIDENGDVTKVKFFNAKNVTYNEYLSKIFLAMPQWKPGIKDGNRVAVAYNVVLE